MPAFLENLVFPDNISYGSSGGPGFTTHVFTGTSSFEQRVIGWSLARGRWNVGYGIRDKADMDAVRRIFYEARGKAHGFRFKDWHDYTVTNSLIGVGNGVTSEYQITKTYGTTNPYVRRITKPVAGTLTVTVNGVPVPVGPANTNNATVNTETGIVTFGASVIPADTHEVRVSCQFHVPVRFDTDQMSPSHEGFETETWGDIPIVEIEL